MPVMYRGHTVFMAEPRAAERRHRSLRKRCRRWPFVLFILFSLCIAAAIVRQPEGKHVKITVRPVKGVEIVRDYKDVTRLSIGPHATAFMYKTSSGDKKFERLDRREYLVSVEED